MQYKIIKKGKTIDDTVYEKSGIKVAFQLDELAQTVKEYTKKETEAKSNAAMVKAILENIKNNYPGVLDIDPKLLQAARLYAEKSEQLVGLNKDLKTIKTSMVDVATEYAAIKKAVGIKEEGALDRALEAYYSKRDVAGETFKKIMKQNKLDAKKG